MPTLRSYARVLVCIAALLAGPLFAHDIPGKATILSFVRPVDDQLQVLVRMPLEAAGEIVFPVRGPGYIDIARADAALHQAAQMYIADGLQFFGNGEALQGRIAKTRISLPGDKAFTDFKTAFAHINGPPLPETEELYWKQAALDVLLIFDGAANKKISVDPNLSRIAMETHTVLRYMAPDGEERIFDFQGYPGRVPLQPSWWFATWQFVSLGFFHILDGVDHLLFLFCLAIPLRSVRALIPAVTAFTVAHSITLMSSALGLIPTSLWFGPLIETLIAASVFYMACENMLGAVRPSRWCVVFAFGLVHGFGFSFILADRMQFAGEHLITALLAFNVGVELGQLLVLLIAVPTLRWLFQRLPAERLGIILLSALAAHTAWHWFVERGSEFLAFKFTWPVFDAAFFVALMRWAMLLMGCGGVLWALSEILKRLPPKYFAASDKSAAIAKP